MPDSLKDQIDGPNSSCFFTQPIREMVRDQGSEPIRRVTPHVGPHTTVEQRRLRDITVTKPLLYIVCPLCLLSMQLHTAADVRSTSEPSQAPEHLYALSLEL